MALDIKVDGVSRNDYVRYRTLRIEKQGARETCRLEFLDHDVTVMALRPDTGAELHITRDGVHLEYGGEITRVTDQRLDGGVGGGTVTIVESRGWYFEAADVRVPYLVLPAQTLQESVESLRATYLAAKGWTNLEASPGGPVLPLLVYTNQTISDIFDDLTKKSGYPWRVNGDRELAFTAAGTLAAPHTYDDSNSIVLRGATWTKERVRRATRLVITTGGTGQYIAHHEDHEGDGVKTVFPVNVLPIEPAAAVNNAAGYAATSTSIAVTGLPASFTIKAGRTFRFAGHGLYTLSGDATTDGAGAVTLSFTPGLAQAVVDDQALTFDAAALVSLEVGGTPTALNGSPWSFSAEQAQFSTSGSAPGAGVDVTYRTRIDFPARVRCWHADAQLTTGAFDYQAVRDSEITWPEFSDVALTKAAGDTELGYRVAEPKELRLATFAQDVYPWMLADCDFASRGISGQYLVQSVILTDVGKRNQDPRVELVLLEGTSIGRDWRAFWMGRDGGAVYVPPVVFSQAPLEVHINATPIITMSQAALEAQIAGSTDTEITMSQAALEAQIEA